MKFLDKGILDVLVPVEINGKEEFIIGSPNISNEQVQEYLDRLNEFLSVAKVNSTSFF